MLSLVKKDFLTLNWVFYVSISMLLIITYMMTINPSFALIISFFSTIFSIYAYEDKNHVNRHFISLPIPKKVLIRSRYLFLLLILLSILSVQWVFMFIWSYIISDYNYIYSWRDIIVFTSIGTILIAIVLPMMTFFKSLYMSSLFILALLGIGAYMTVDQLVQILNLTEEEMIVFNELDAGYVLLAEKYIPYYPYVSLVMIASVVLWGSMKLSTCIFSKKDI